jgi:hypothetical protein
LFAAQYGNLIKKGLIDRAWLVSHGPISAEGRNEIRTMPGRTLDCFTFVELQRKLFLIDNYLADITATYRSSALSTYYVQPTLLDGTDLETFVLDWLDDEAAFPLAIVGGYGQGKSTFALSLAQKLITLGQSNPTTRVPILIPLGDIADEQSVEGLVGKLLASRHRVENYHYHLFSALNESGPFLLIFDGFAEMKHGMTFGMFERNIVELMRLDRGLAKDNNFGTQYDLSR